MYFESLVLCFLSQDCINYRPSSLIHVFFSAGEKTDNWMGLVEMMLSTSVCGMIFSLASGQPLLIIGGTGPVLIFEEYLYKVGIKDSM